MTQAHPLLTADEVAERFGTTAESVRRWARNGQIPSVKLPSGRVKFRRTDVDALIPPVESERATA